MNSLLPIFAAAAVVICIFLLMLVWLSRYTKVGPNQALIVSGRKRQLPDGSTIGYRVVIGGGTFVFPVIEKADVLSLELMTLEIPAYQARTAGGVPVKVDVVSQFKINADDASIAAAAQHFLSKSAADTRNTVRTILEQDLATTLGNLSLEDISQNPQAIAAATQSAATPSLAKMGLSLITLTVTNPRPV